MRTLPRFLAVTVLLAATLLLSAPVLAQGGEAISYGAPVSGEITNEAPELLYTFQGSAGDTIIITMTASQPGLDSFLELRGPDGQTLVADDDSGGNLNSLIGPYALPADGTYTVVATRFMRQQGSSSGPFTLLVDQASMTPISVNEATTVELSDSQPVAFFSYANMGRQVFSLSAQGQGGEAGFVVSVRDTAGSIVNQVYGAPDGSALLDPLVLSQEGTYTLAVTRQQQGPPTPEVGSVRLTMTLRMVETQPLPFDTPISGTLNDESPSAHLVFEGEQGQVLRLSGSQGAEGLPFDAQVIGPDGNYLNSGGTAYGPAPGTLVIDPLVLNASGQHMVVVTRADTTGQGVAGRTSSYTLTLSQTETPLLTPGQEVTGSFDAQSFERVYRFEGSAGQQVRFTLRSLDGAYGPGMDVQGPGYGPPVMEAGGGMVGFFSYNVNSTMAGTVSYETTLPTDGTYLFRVRNAASVGSGPEAPPPAGTFGLLVEVIE